jgi:glycosyltransferase involved in cell wall biosynthesis
MRVLMFGWEFPPFVAGGLATATLGLVKGLLGCGIDVTLVVPFGESVPVTMPGLRLVHAPEIVQQLHGRVGLRRVASPITPYGTPLDLTRSSLAGGRWSASPVYGPDLWTEVERFAAVAGEIAAVEPHDIIDAHDWITYAAGLHAREVSGRPLVVHVHATEFDRSGAGANPMIVDRERAGLMGAERVISNSELLKRRVVQAYGVAPDRIDVVYWGVEPAEPTPRTGRRVFGPDVPVVVFVGRVTRQKGPRYFIDAARRVAEFVPEARFIVAGDGDELPAIMARTAELGLADRVFFTGGLDREGVDEVLRIADVCVMPSVNEPFGLVALESLRSGTPCIVPRESGVAEVVRHAFHADFWDIDEMTNQIVALLKYPALHAELRAQGLAELAAPRFGLIEPARNTIGTYRRVLAAAGVVV